MYSCCHTFTYFQSGVLFLGYNFGLPVIASDVGSLREDIVEGKTGFVCKPRDPIDLAKEIERYFSSELYRRLDNAAPGNSGVRQRKILMDESRPDHTGCVHKFALAVAKLA